MKDNVARALAMFAQNAADEISAGLAWTAVHQDVAESDSKVTVNTSGAVEASLRLQVTPTTSGNVTVKVKPNVAGADEITFTVAVTAEAVEIDVSAALRAGSLVVDVFNGGEFAGHKTATAGAALPAFSSFSAVSFAGPGPVITSAAGAVDGAYR